jgi:hypothetical protein
MAGGVGIRLTGGLVPGVPQGPPFLASRFCIGLRVVKGALLCIFHTGDGWRGDAVFGGFPYQP